MELKEVNNSKSFLYHHEKSQDSFASKKIDGFGMRDYFWEEEMLREGIMDKKKATKLGYIRIVDFESSRRYLDNNEAIMDHATAEIKPHKLVFSFKSVLLANFAFTLRIILYHVFIVALANNPLILIIVLLSIEFGYMFLIVKNFIILKYLVSVHLFISKVTQAMFLFFFHMVSLLIFFQNGPESSEPPSVSL